MNEYTIKMKFILLLICLPQFVLAQASIPKDIQPPKGHNPYLTVYATGVQIYQCVISQGSYSWQVQAPDATLYNEKHEIIGKHYKGPIWEYNKGSRIEGRVVNSLFQSDNAISWLLVEVVSKHGDGPFSAATYINRFNTIGGISPITGCDANHLGIEKKTTYSASYLFYKPSS